MWPSVQCVMWYVCVWFLLIYPIYTQLFLIYEEEGGWLPPAAVAPLAPHMWFIVTQCAMCYVVCMCVVPSYLSYIYSIIFDLWRGGWLVASCRSGTACSSHRPWTILWVFAEVCSDMSVPAPEWQKVGEYDRLQQFETPEFFVPQRRFPIVSGKCSPSARATSTAGRGTPLSI